MCEAEGVEIYQVDGKYEIEEIPKEVTFEDDG